MKCSFPLVKSTSSFALIFIFAKQIEFFEKLLLTIAVGTFVNEVGRKCFFFQKIKYRKIQLMSLELK